VPTRPSSAVLALLACALAACGGGSGGGDPDPFLADGFEAGLGAWAKGADVPLDPNNPPEFVAWSIEASTEQASEGTTSARYDLDGTQDDGTIWLVRALDVGAGAHVVTLSFDLWSESESFNQIAKVAAYVGADPPAVEADFDTTEAANLADGWVRYEYEVPVTAGPDGLVRVAMGISAVFESVMTYYVDDVRVFVE
jgi:hypothetical protein